MDEYFSPQEISVVQHWSYLCGLWPELLLTRVNAKNLTI
jgi:hypothetical protein